MDVFDFGRAFTDMWTLGGKAFLTAQETAARAMAEGMRTATLPADLAGDSAELARAARSATDMWGSALRLSQALAERLPGGAAVDPTVEATWQKMVDPRSWMGGVGEMDEVLSRMAEGPQFSDLWNVERRYARVFRAWLDLRRRGLEHNAVVLDAWQRAGASFSRQLDGLTQAGTAPDARGTMRLWTDIANAVLLETQRAYPFLQTQTRLIQSSTELRLAQTDLVEYYGERFGFPTRRELDDVHHTVAALRRELRALRRQARAPAAAQAPPTNITAAPAPRPRRTVARKAGRLA